MGLLSRRPNARLLLLGTGYGQRLARLGSLGLVLPLGEASGTTALDATSSGRDGTYSGTGITLAQLAGPGNSMGRAPLFDGAAGQLTFGAGALTSLNTAFNPGLFTVAAWVWMGSAALADANPYVAFTVGGDAINRVMLQKLGASNLGGVLIAGGVTVAQLSAVVSANTWVHLALTGNLAATRARVFVNGVQVSTDQTYTATWAGALASSFTQIGSYTSLLWWPGNIAWAMMARREYTPAEIRQLATAS